MRTLRRKLVFLLILSAITPLAVFGVISLFSVQRTLRESIRESYREITSRAAEEIALYLNHAREILQTLAQDISETGLNQEQQQRILDNYVLRFTQFMKIRLYSPELRLGYSTSLEMEGQESPDEAFLRKASRVDFLFSPPFLGEDLTPALWLSIALKGQHSFSGLVVAKLDLMKMWKWVGDTRIGKWGFASVVDDSGRVIASGDPRYKKAILSSSKEVTFSGFSPHLEPQGPQVLSTQQGSYLMAVKSIAEDPHWYLILAQPTKEAFAPLRQLLWILLGLILGTLTMMALLGMWGSRRTLLRPVASLREATRALGRGDLAYRVPDLGNDELGELGQSFNLMAERLVEFQEQIRRQERLAMFGRIASGLAHDLKHPVKNIESAAKLMEQMYEDEAYRKTFTRIVQREFSRINHFLEDLRNLTHEMPFLPQMFDLSSLIAEVHESFSGLAQDQGVDLEVSLPQESVKVWGDPHLLRRVIENLLANAFQAMGNKKGRVGISFSLASSQGVVLKIWDEGPGIPPERLQGLFEEFATTKRKGLGLGLAITKRIIDLHRGDIRVDSEVGKGTCFTLTWQPPSDG